MLLLVLLALCLPSSSAPSECEKRVPASFTAAQKQQLCADGSGGGSSGGSGGSSGSSGSGSGFGSGSGSGGISIGPAICATVAKHLHASFDTILQLCQGASSAAPAQCLGLVGVKAKHGLDLCRGAATTLSGECYEEISALKGKKVGAGLVPFCAALDDRAPLLCMLAVHKTGLLPLPQALEHCSLAVGAVGRTSNSTSGGGAGGGGLAAVHTVRTLTVLVL